MRRPRFHTVTFGCKLNRFDSAAIEGELSRRGYAASDDPAEAEIVVFNTCTVTGKADSDARTAVRRVRRQNPNCVVLVTGCYAEREARELESIAGVDRVFGNRDKQRIGEILDELGVAARLDGPTRYGTMLGDRGCDTADGLPDAVHFGERSRAFLKIQEGCDLRCSYCVIPRVRGASRSVPPARVEQALDALLAAGFREVVLTGVNTGDYGRDLPTRTDLEALVRRLLSRCGSNRLRLNSLEPRTVTHGIVELMARDPRLAPHLQIPLQSGSDAVLRAMRRNYRARTYRERLAFVAARVPGVGLGADVIVGFPGESDAQFEETVRVVADSPLAYLHVFGWSPRPGTPAAERTGRLHGAVIRERSARLREVGARLNLDFRRRHVGSRLDAVVIDSGTNESPGRALTGNFIEVELPGSAASRGDLVELELMGADARGTRGTIVGVPKWAATRRGGHT